MKTLTKLKVCIWHLVCSIFTVTMGKMTFKESDKSSETENIVISANRLRGTLNMYSGISGEYWVSIMPSINTSGYGLTEEESVDDLKMNVDIFLKYLFSLTDARRQVELRKMGWAKNRYFKRKYSNTFVDKEGLLQNFDDPNSVKSKRLQTV